MNRRVCGSEKVFWVGKAYRVTASSPDPWISHRTGKKSIRGEESKAESLRKFFLNVVTAAPG